MGRQDQFADRHCRSAYGPNPASEIGVIAAWDRRFDRRFQISGCSAMSRASSTSMPIPYAMSPSG